MSEEPTTPVPGANDSKVYQLKSAPLSAPKPTIGRYWALWKQVERTRRGVNRFALTQRVLGRVVKVPEMSEAELGRMIRVFESMLRKGKHHGGTEAQSFIDQEKFPRTEEASNSAASAASEEAPSSKGLDTGSYKPLMRNSSGHSGPAATRENLRSDFSTGLATERPETHASGNGNSCPDQQSPLDGHENLPLPAMMPSPDPVDGAEPCDGAASEENSGWRSSERLGLEVGAHETPAVADVAEEGPGLTPRQQQIAGARRALLQGIRDMLVTGASQETAAKAWGLSPAGLSRLLNSVGDGEKRLSAVEKCERLLMFPVERLAPDQARGAQSAFEWLAAQPEVQRELERLYLLTINSSSEYMGSARRTGSAALTLERFADSPLCKPENLRAKLRSGSRPRPLMQVIRRITAELEQRHRGQRHYELHSIIGRRERVIEMADGTRVPLEAGGTWVFDDMSTNYPFWFEAPAEAGIALGVKKLVERHGCGLGRQGLYAWDWGSNAWLGVELVGRVRDAYTADIILRFFRRLMQTYGKPDTIVLEQSVWKARAIDGFAILNDQVVEEQYERPAMEEPDKALLQDGLRALGIRLIYTWTPRGKPIEGGFHQVQKAFPTFCAPGEGINIGRYAGEFERAAVAMRRAGDGVKHPRELGFLHIARHADVSWETMQWLNGRDTGARAGKPAELLMAGMTSSPRPALTQRDLACFLPDMRELQIRGGHVWPTVDGVSYPFIHPEHFADLGNGYLVSVKFDPAEPTLGAAIYNRDTSSRNHRGYAQGQFICWASLHEDAPVISLRDRSQDEGRQLIASYKRFHRTAYRALDIPKQQTVKIEERRDGAGQVATAGNGAGQSAAADACPNRGARETRASQDRRRTVELPYGLSKLLAEQECT